MMRILAFFIFFFTIFAPLSGQNPSFRWARQIGGTLGQEGISVTIDASQNVYSTGQFQGTMDFDPGPGVFNLTSAGGYDTYIVKIDSAGNFIWAKSFGGANDDAPTAIMTHSNNGLIISGTFSTLVDFNPGAATFTFMSNGYQDGYLVKLDLSGNFVWAKQIGGAEFDACNALTADANNNIYIVGYFADTVDFDPGPLIVTLTTTAVYSYEDIFLLKLDAAGNFLMVKQIGSWSWDIGTAVTLDASNNIYIGGSFSAIADLDPGPGTFTIVPGGNMDACVIKLDPSGNFLWAKSLQGDNYETVTSMAVDQNNNIYIAGNFMGTPDFDTGPGTFTVASLGLWDMYLLKLTAGGIFTATHQWGSNSNEYVRSLDIDCSDNKYLGGCYSETVDFNSGVGVNNLYSYDFSGFILKMDAGDSYSWVKDLGFSSGTSSVMSSDTQINDCAISKVDGSIYSTGLFSETSDMDPGVNTYTFTSVGGSDVFLHKLMQCTTPPAPGITGNLNFCGGPILNLSGCGDIKWYATVSSTVVIATGLTFSIAPLPPGTYTYFAQAAGGCNFFSAKVPVSFTVNSSPTITINASPSIICTGQSATLNATGASTYSWNTASTNPAIIVSPLTSTLYTVTGTGLNGCKSQSSYSLVVSGCVGLTEENEENQFTLYPNPTDGFFNFKDRINESQKYFMLYNSLGQLVYSGTTHINCDVSWLAPGIYYLTVDSLPNNPIKLVKY